VLAIDDLGATNASGFRLAGLSFSVAPGERVAVLGPNGSGKSFLLRVIVGLEAPLAGTISWKGVALSSAGRVLVPPDARSMGVIFQDVALFPTLDVAANVAIGLAPRTSADLGRRLVERALETAHVAHLRRRSVLALSGGEQQRTALARALVQRPGVLLLDEPFHSLDGPAKREILADLLQVVREADIATVLVTHDTDEAAAFSDRVVLLRAGRAVQQGTFAEIYDAPVDQAAAELLGLVQTIDVESARRNGIALPAGVDAPLVRFRPEQLLLGPAQGGETPCAEVADIRARGALDDVLVRLPDGTTLLSRTVAGASPPAGRTVSTRIGRALAWSSSEELAT
jgi:iron(III) transport system ATP-binding protein